MRLEQEKTKSETRRLRETNKSLLQKTVNEQKYRERLLREIAELKSQISQNSAGNEGDDASEGGRAPDNNFQDESIWGFRPPSPTTWRLGRSTNGLDESDSYSTDPPSDRPSFPKEIPDLT